MEWPATALITNIGHTPCRAGRDESSSRPTNRTYSYYYSLEGFSCTSWLQWAV